MKHTFGLVLGGGGTRGVFHMGVIKAIQELKLDIKEISGVSIGAVIAVLYASNPQIDFEKLLQEMDFLRLVEAIISGTNRYTHEHLETFLRSYVKVSTFNELHIKTRFTASDLNNNREIVFQNGEIFPGLLASISIPGVFTPCRFENTFLVDGGVMNNIPIPLIKRERHVIISDISGPIKKINADSMPMDILYSSFAQMQQNYSLSQAKGLHKKFVYLNLDDDRTFILDFRRNNFQSLFNLGYEAMMKKKEEVLKETIWDSFSAWIYQVINR